MPTFEVTGDAVAVEAGYLLGGMGEVEPVGRLYGGRSHAAWLLRSPGGLLVAKVPVREPGPGYLERVEEHQRLWEHGARVPRVLASTGEARLLQGQPLTVLTYLPGTDAAVAWPRLSSAQASQVVRDVGAALGQMHQISVAGFGDPATGMGLWGGSWADVVETRASTLTGAYEELERSEGASVTRLARQGLGLLTDLAAEVSAYVAPAVCHLDVYRPNILVDEHGRFRALLDLEHLRRVDPVMDFVKPALWMFSIDEKSADSATSRAHARVFLEGYEETAAKMPQRWAERVSVATGLELLSGVQYWIRVGDEEMRADYTQRLHAWVSSAGAVHTWSALVP